MHTRRAYGAAAAALLVCVLLVGCSSSSGDSEGSTAPVANTDVTLRAGSDVVATVDPRYLSYNIEMVEVTGGNFWAPYDAGDARVPRPPIDLSSTRLRHLASALGPAYIRVSGSWANSAYFDADGTTGGAVPKGFGSVLTTAEWAGVGAFATAVGGKIVTSFASNDAVRDASGHWQPAQARALLRFSAQNHVPLAAVELFNEPNIGIGMPAGYGAADFADDVATLRSLLDAELPDVQIVGPGTTAETKPLVVKPTFTAADVLSNDSTAFDVFSYHFYPKVSERCGSPEGPEVALTQEFLGRVSSDRAHYLATRNRYLRHAPVWVTETAEAACGGDRWASTFRDVIRFVDTLGRLADSNGAVVFHNTLSASDYGLLDEDGLVPRPDYWAAVLWHQLMGTKVLRVTMPHPVSDLSVYAHCTAAGSPQRGVAYAVVNASKTEARTVATASGSAVVYHLTATDLDAKTTRLNGKELAAAADGTLPALTGAAESGAVTVQPASVAFVVDPEADSACN